MKFVWKGTVAVALLAGAAFSVNAQTPSYAYVEGGYAHINVDERNVSDEDGWFAGFSIPIAQRFFLSGSFETYDYRFTDLEIIKIDFGYLVPINEQTDFNVTLGYNRISAGPADADGVRGTVGVRSRMARYFEGRAYAGYVADSNAGDFVLGVEGNIPFTDNFALSLQAETYEFDINLFRVGARFMF